MKTKIFTIAALMLMSVGAFAQKNSLGLRLGGDNEISYQRYLSSKGRLEMGLGLNGFDHDYLGLSGVYQWVWNVTPQAPGLKWYAGLGAGLGLYHHHSHNHFSAAVLGQIGLEYTFKVPFSLSIDYRPGFNVVPNGEFMGSGIALGLRYRF